MLLSVTADMCFSEEERTKLKGDKAIVHNMEIIFLTATAAELIKKNYIWVSRYFMSSPVAGSRVMCGLSFKV